VSADSIALALDAMRAAGDAAGLDRGAVDDEAAEFVAAIDVNVSGAATAWSQVFGLPVATFPAAAARGRSWRDRPTALLSTLVATSPDLARDYARALADLAAAAYGLGDASMSALGVAGVAAAAQLRAVGGSAALSELVQSPSTAPPTATTASTTASATATATAPVTPEPALPTLDELLAELDGLVGLATVKAEVHRQAELLRIEAKRTAKGLKTPDVARHLVFVGNPGTGKSTVARLVGGIYRALGLLTGGHVVETDRSGLVAGYLGQTAEKTAAVLAKSYGGLLFIDEAYALVGDQYGDEAIATLVKAMEDHRDELVVIVAGYPGPMQRFIDANPGLASRFHLTIVFDDYSDDELTSIFEGNCRMNDFTPTDACLTALRLLLSRTPRGEGFGNARFVRNTFEAAVVRQAWRLREVADPTVEQLRNLGAEDLVDPDELVAPPS
jgi:Holliday junction resolvasome RuvABC ATP-dependent DNA helicase subunit